MPTWSQMKAAVEEQGQLDPQRAKLSTMAWQGVEAGLAHLAAVGYNFEICPKGTLAELVEARQPQMPLPLGIADAQALLAKPKAVQTQVFEAIAGKDSLNAN